MSDVIILHGVILLHVKEKRLHSKEIYYKKCKKITKL